jgi:hypothetical protein
MGDLLSAAGGERDGREGRCERGSAGAVRDFWA